MGHSGSLPKAQSQKWQAVLLVWNKTSFSDTFVLEFNDDNGSGQVVIGGYDENYSQLSSIELFPLSDACSIPDLPQPRFFFAAL